EDIPEFVGLRAVEFGAAALVYAVFRLLRFHPACNPAYSAWLEMSPWTAAKPLPVGPVHLVWQDAVVVGSLAALTHWHALGDPLIPIITFGITYFCGLTLLLAITRRWTSCLVLGFLWPALLLPEAKGWARAALITAIVIVLFHGLRASLRAFPHGFFKTSAN